VPEARRVLTKRTTEVAALAEADARHNGTIRALPRAGI
jgi:hypothetical protein